MLMSWIPVSERRNQQFNGIDGSKVKLLVDPTVILLSTKIDDTVFDHFDPEARSGQPFGSDNDQFRLPYLLETRPPSDFHYDAAKDKLASLDLIGDDGPQISFNIPGEMALDDQANNGRVSCQQGQLLRLAGWIDMDSRVTVSLNCENTKCILIHA